MFYGVHTNTIRDWWKLYKKEGSKSLSYQKRGAKSENKKLLNPAQELKVQNIEDKLNKRPRKRHKYETPIFVMNQLLFNSKVAFIG